jgi:2-dehydropantoate 2-reductase
VRFAILGAGAVGAFVGARLARAGCDVVLIARGPHLEAMRQHGLRVIETEADYVVPVRCTDRLEAVGEGEVVLVTLKAHSLPAVAPALGRALSPGATAVFCQNGVPWWWFAGTGEPLEAVDPGGVIAASIPLDRVLGAVVYVSSILVQPGVVRHLEGTRISLGEPDGSRGARAPALSADLRRAGLKAPVQTDLRREIWLKLLGNATLNPISALTRLSLGELLGQPDLRDLVRTAMLEVEAVGRALGIEPDLSAERRLEGAARVAEHRTSMLQDVEAGRPLEVEALVGAVVELGRRLGVATPVLDVVYRLARGLDRGLRQGPGVR